VLAGVCTHYTQLVISSFIAIMITWPEKKSLMHMLEEGNDVLGVLWLRWPGLSEARDLFGAFSQIGACLTLHCCGMASCCPTWDLENGLCFRSLGMWNGVQDGGLHLISDAAVPDGSILSEYHKGCGCEGLDLKDSGEVT
jgi:hypothetical protein